MEDMTSVTTPQDAMECYLRTRIPSEWFQNGTVGYAELSGDIAHQVSPGAEQVYVVAPPAMELESYWLPTHSSAPLRLVGMRVLLVFSSSAELLAEIHTNGGAFAHAILSTAGEEDLGRMLRDWQTTGVPSLCADGACVLVVRRVGLRSPAFYGQAADWLSAQGYRIVQTTAEGVGDYPAPEKLAKQAHKKQVTHKKKL